MRQKSKVSRMSGFDFMNEKLQFLAVFQKLQSHCGSGYRCPINMKLCQSHFLDNWELLWASAPQKFEEWFLVTN